MNENARTLADFMESVWNRGDASAVDRFIADEYRIHSDPGDPWEGATLSREGFKERLHVSRAPFPDLRFEIGETIAEGDRVAIAWRMRGTHTGPLGPYPATGAGSTCQARPSTTSETAGSRGTGRWSTASQWRSSSGLARGRPREPGGA